MPRLTPHPRVPGFNSFLNPPSRDRPALICTTLRHRVFFYLAVLFLPLGTLISQETGALLPAHLYIERLENPGLAIQTAREIAEDPAFFPVATDPSYLEVLVKGLYFLELNQDYPRALSIMNYLDTLSVVLPAEMLEPFYGTTTFGLLSMRIPEYYVSLGDFTKARQWLSSRIPGLTDTREIHYAALVLARILNLEGRFDQAQQLLESRFLQPLRQGILPPFGAKALVTGVDLFLESNQGDLAQEMVELVQERYPGSLESLLILHTLGMTDDVTGDDSEVSTLPVPGTLLAGSEAFSLGLVTLNPLPIEAPVSETPPVTVTVPVPGPRAETPPELPAPVSDENSSDPRGFIQIGSFSSPTNAERFEGVAREKGFSVVRRQATGGGPIRLLVPVDERGSTTLQLVLRESGIEGFYVAE